MSHSIKNQKNILKKLSIEKLNAMQEEAQLAIHSCSDIILLSPTGTGKTLAFLLPIIAELDPECEEVQALIVAPSRELAIQIEQVLREMGSGYKTSVVYGGRLFSKDKIDLKHRPAILVGTPGRISDHIRRNTFSTSAIKTLVLDEFDKSLEVGFETEMSDICSALPKLKKKILTSATQKVRVPKFVGLTNPVYINYLKEVESQLEVKAIISPSKDKLETLVQALDHLGNQPGIIFCNFKESIRRVSEHLTANNISHGCFYGGMEQKDRERALIKFRNGTHQLIIATDLAARGIDVPEIKFKYRKEILENIKNVDQVIPANFYIDDDYLRKNKIDYLVHGNDNKNNIKKKKIKIFSRTKSISSTIIRKKALQILKKKYERKINN